MTEVSYSLENGEKLRVNLRAPYLAAAIAWLWPGAGHIYQGRYAKGMLFMICVLSTFVFGMVLGQGRVVYASTKPGDFRWQYFLQIHNGLPALPALIQARKTAKGGDPFFVLCERYPDDYGTSSRQTEKDYLRSRLRFQRIAPETRAEDYPSRTLKDGFMAPPAGPIDEQANDVLGQWHSELKHAFDLGTYFTVVAGLLNLLVIYDAFAGPAILPPQVTKSEVKPESTN